MSTKNVVLGVLAGAVAGSILGVMFAPDKGKTTRKMIVDKSQTLLSGLEQVMEGYLTDFTKKLEQMKIDFISFNHHKKSGMEDLVNDAVNAKK